MDREALSVDITLPWPPSLNRYYRAVKDRVLIDRAGRAYQRLVAKEAMLQRARNRFGVERLRVEIVAHPPDRRRRDLDNMLKAMLDALQSARVFDDDELIDDLRIRRGEVVDGGRMQVWIVAIPAVH